MPILAPEPKLNDEHTVRESVEDGMGAVFAAKGLLDAVYTAYGEPDADFDALAAEQARLEAIIATSGTDSEHQLEIAADALRQLHLRAAPGAVPRLVLRPNG